MNHWVCRLEKVLKEPHQDFSLPDATKELLPLVVEAKKPLVIGTTGIPDDGKKKIADAATMQRKVHVTMTSLLLLFGWICLCKEQ